MKLVHESFLPCATRRRELKVRKDGEQETLATGNLRRALDNIRRFLAVDSGQTRDDSLTFDASHAASYAAKATDAHARMSSAKADDYQQVAAAAEGCEWSIRAILAGANPRRPRQIFNDCWAVIKSFGIEGHAAALQAENADIKIPL